MIDPDQTKSWMEQRERRRAAFARHTAYVEALSQFCEQHDWVLHPNQGRLCLDLLKNPAHRCIRHYRITDDDRYLGHVELFRRGPAKHPTQWAILSQNYDLQKGVDHLGPAPYGHGTHAYLYVGATT